MIEARHQEWAQHFFRLYVRRLLKRHFHAVHLLGERPHLDETLPLIIVVNHSTWWDGFFVHLINKELLHRKIYLMMLDRQLRKYSFFSRVGAFGIEPGSRRGVLDSLNYSVRILRSAGEPNPNALCVFPQGEMKPWGVRPLGFRNGLEWIIKRFGAPLQLLQVAMRCEFLDDQRADVFFLFTHQQCDWSGFTGLRQLEQSQEQLMNRLSDRIKGSEKGEILLEGRKSVNERWDAFRAEIDGPRPGGPSV